MNKFTGVVHGDVTDTLRRSLISAYVNAGYLMSTSGGEEATKYAEMQNQLDKMVATLAEITQREH